MSAYLMLLIPVTIWGSNFVVGSWLVGQFQPLALAEFRLIFTSTFLLGFAFMSRKMVRIHRREWTYLLFIGLIGTLLNQTFFFESLIYINSTEAALIMSLAPIVTSILAYFFLKEALTFRMLIGSMIAVFGVYLLVSYGKQGISIGLGDVLAAGAMLSFAISVILIRKLAQTLESIPTTVYSTVFGACMFIPIVYVSSQNPVIPHSIWPWIIAVLSGILSQGLGGLLWNQAIIKVGASKASIFLNLQPFIAMVVGYLALGMPITSSQLLGGVLIVSGVIFSTLRIENVQSKKKPMLPTG